MYDGAMVPSPQENTNGFAQASASTNRPKQEEEPRKAEPVLVKKAHREILDHERKRRVELKCMELQEMMEEQGYSEEEIRQKVGTFRQMLMEKEGVITREDSHGHPISNHLPYENENMGLEEGYIQECDCHADCYDRDHRDYRIRSSSSPSPPPKKKKKKKCSRRRSRFDRSSLSRKEKKKKNGKKHKRDRSASGPRKKRRYRSGSPKNKHKSKNKQRKRSPAESPGVRSHRRGSCCSSRSASMSSLGSPLKSPSRLTPKHTDEEQKVFHTPSSCSKSPSPMRGSRSSTPWQNGHRDSTKNGQENSGNEIIREKTRDTVKSLSASPRVQSKLASAQPGSKDSKVQKLSTRIPGAVSPSVRNGSSDDEKQMRRRRSRSTTSSKRSSRQKTSGTAQQETTSHTGCSSDSGHSHHSNCQKNKSLHVRKTKNFHEGEKHHRGRVNSRKKSLSLSPVKHEKHSRHNSERKKSSSRSLRHRSSTWSSRSPSRSHSRSREWRSKSRSPHSRQNESREKDNEARTHHTDTETRARRRSRSYSPIRKRRRDSPSFMEPRRITSARKRPIPYYRPSPTSPSSLSSYSSSSRSRSRSYGSYSTYSRSRTSSRSRSRSRSRTQSRNRSHSYYSRSSSESTEF
uniref:Serine/arginine repetitive matrix 3 n=1 Tax=Erpetoichthys calabaricus TaxID=27687 RepID=A0A8C4T4E6_ERPCA